LLQASALVLEPLSIALHPSSVEHLKPAP